MSVSRGLMKGIKGFRITLLCTRMYGAAVAVRGSALITGGRLKINL